MRTTWDLFRDMDSLRRELDRVFEGAEWPFGRMRPFYRTSFLPGLGARAYPLVNVSEDEDAIYVEALAPGVNADSLDVSITGDRLTISGEKPAMDEGVKAEAYHRNERAAGRFTRTITLPSEVEDEKAEADYVNGILRLNMPKAASAKPRKISVRGA